jgi:glycosyltransferase involved in cell wall biosynthesis
MRVALVAPLVFQILPAQAYGPNSIILDLARGLRSRGHKVRVYAAAGSAADEVDIRPIDVDPIARSAAVRPGEAPREEGRLALQAAFETLFSELRAERFDAISQHAFDAPAIELADGLPVMHTLHLPPVERSVVDAAKATRAPLVAVSQASRRDWLAVGVAPVGVILNGVPVPEWSGETPSVEPIALVAGRISPEKGTDAAVRVARLAGLKPRIVGDIYDAAYYQAYVKPLLQEAEFVGPMSRTALGREMSRAAVLLMPIAWNEPFGLVAAEAQMVGCPVVGYRRGALPEIVPDGVGGYLVEPGDEAALVEAIPRARSLDRAAIRERARAELGVDRMVDGYESALLAVARGAGGLVG